MDEIAHMHHWYNYYEYELSIDFMIKPGNLIDNFLT